MRSLIVLAALAAVCYAQIALPACSQAGKYTCVGSDIYVCNASKRYTLSSKCNKDCCRSGSGVAHCIC